MLGYVFWHRPAEGGAPESYERAQDRFHRSLAARPPEGYRGSACFRVADVEWLGDGGPGYEDWYLVDDFAALGVLRQAAVSAGHRTAHEEAAKRVGDGTGGLYRLAEGCAALEHVRVAVWVSVPREQPEDVVAGLLLGDGLDRRRGGLWRRELTFGPAPEYCVLGPESPSGVGPERLADRWRAEVQEREAVVVA